MNQYIDKPHLVFSSEPSEIALSLWKSRFQIEIGDVSSVTFGYSIAIHRLSETEFALIVGNLSHTESGKVIDAIREHSGV